MPWQDFLRRSVVTAVALATARRVRVAAQLLLLAALVFAVLRLRSIWHDGHVRLAHAGWGWLTGSLLLGISAVVASGFIWLAILGRLGVATRGSWTATYLQGQLGKYVPGSVWQYASRAALASQRGVPLRPVARSFAVELSATIYAGAAFSMLLLGWWGALGVVGVVAATPLAASRLRRGATLRIAAQVVGFYAASWLLVLGSVWMAARGVAGVASSDLPFLTGAFAAAWIVGVFTVYAPSGLGVREAVLVALLRSRVGLDDAVLVAVATRAILTLADLFAGGISFLVARGPRRAPAEPATGASR